ncbi:non-canonical purine NTP pyrophosphatase [Anaeromyxobacter oryzae]|uniref:non-canonical purine NTP pyrophosphatase n=1 Tax=Anaeromyxobacter oryzae TaxID=2918170 RepID=UPI0020BD4E74|nr:non-canonical purine NTP pyrophosphatase [Anaeromyxobacter oryzae]
MRLFFGTTNPGKLRELRRLVAGLPVVVVSPDDLGRAVPEVEEDGATFQANAEKKASAWARWSGLHTLADDSGLCVDALGGAPGVHSARWSDLGGGGPASPVCELAGAAEAELGPVAGRAARDERNNDKLLASLGGVEDARRGSEYEAVLSLARPDGGIEASVTGVCRGRIGHARRGTGGFGYDPLFVPEAELARAAREPGRPARTMAELSAEEKDALSHRGAAFRQILPVLARLAGARRP